MKEIIREYISKEDLVKKTQELAAMIEKDYEGEEPWHIRPENKWTEREVF